MNYGLYNAYLGLKSRERTLEALANNLANASTNGFKADRLNYGAVSAKIGSGKDQQDLVSGVTTASRTDFTTGTIHDTGRALDVAIDGDAFFTIQTPRGVRYTRDGNFTLDAQGQLVTHNGDLVVGQNGPITIPEGADVAIGTDGTISVDGNRTDQLRLTRFNNPAAALTKEGATEFLANGNENPQENVSSRVLSGALEGSNINSVSELVAMIRNNREFESLQRNVTLLMNDLGRKIAGDIGRI